MGNKVKTKIIKFNDRFSFHRDKYCWNVHENVPGKDKHGEAKIHVQTTYHPSLEVVAKFIIDKSCGDCHSLEEIISLLAPASKSLAKELVLL